MRLRLRLSIAMSVSTYVFRSTKNPQIRVLERPFLNPRTRIVVCKGLGHPASEIEAQQTNDRVRTHFLKPHF